MSRMRYEPVPQREEVIILDHINAQHYNYNSGIPTSVSSASSIHTPSLIAPSVPSSPPPSFHTHSSPGTPRPIPSTRSVRSGTAPSYAELWGVAPSTTGETEMTMGTSNDALATIAGLKQRIEWLEESLGRLLLEKEQNSSTAHPLNHKRDNCCVTFTDASPDLEHQLTSGGGQNCCVSFRSTKVDAKREQQRVQWFAGLAFFTVMLLFFGSIFLSGLTRHSGHSTEAASVKMMDGNFEQTGLKLD